LMAWQRQSSGLIPHFMRGTRASPGEPDEARSPVGGRQWARPAAGRGQRL
jgi:hypothetical protein